MGTVELDCGSQCYVSDKEKLTHRTWRAKARISLIEAFEIASLKIEVFEANGNRGSPGRYGWCVEHASGRDALDLIGGLDHVGTAQLGFDDVLGPLNSTLKSCDRVSTTGQEPCLNLSRCDGSVRGDPGCELYSHGGNFILIRCALLTFVELGGGPGEGIGTESSGDFWADVAVEDLLVPLTRSHQSRIQTVWRFRCHGEESAIHGRGAIETVQ
jgi:hypothetical protein